MSPRLVGVGSGDGEPFQTREPLAAQMEGTGCDIPPAGRTTGQSTAEKGTWEVKGVQGNGKGPVGWGMTRGEGGCAEVWSLLRAHGQKCCVPASSTPEAALPATRTGGRTFGDPGTKARRSRPRVRRA